MAYSNSNVKGRIQSFFPELSESDLDIFLAMAKYKTARNKEVILIGGRLVHSLN